MALSPGTRLGAYEITGSLGAGGMGEVYRARDTKLNRDVALKVLPDLFANDPDRLARFTREAHTLAALNHPNIAAIYGLEESAGADVAGHGPRVRALVMELVEGDDLSERIARGRVPLDEALPIAKQIAQALEAAHEQGIVHRDLKPANIKVRPDGTVKVLDFGLAKAMEHAPPGLPAGVPPEGGTYDPKEDYDPREGVRRGDLQVALPPSQAPTITSPAHLRQGYGGAGMTGAGMILGTAAYMSPEQARGKSVDKRADIWAFGAVLFEMLAGTRPFEGDDIVETLGAVIHKEPVWSRLPADVPTPVRAVLERCLRKDPKERLRDIGDLGILLEATPHTAAAAPPSRLWPAVAATLLAVASGLAFVHFRESPRVDESVRFQIPAPGSGVAQMFALSADGKFLAFVASANGPEQLWVRAMDTLESRALAGTEGASFPFWSPDGQFLGFFAQGKLKKVALEGGPSQTLTDVASARGGTWNQNGVILFSAGPNSPILRVSSAGGVAEPVTTLTGGGVNEGHRYPSFLPDGTHFFFNAGSDKPDASGVFVASLDGMAPVRLLPDVTNGLYAPPPVSGGSGWLLFRRDGALMAQPFDASDLRTTGEMFPIAERVALGAPLNTFGAFSVAANGTLLYRSAGASANRELVWMDRTGKNLGTATKPAAIAVYALSPDGNTLAMGIGNNPGAGADLWLQDLTRDVLTRFTFRAGNNRMPVWSPDGRQVTYSMQNSSGYSYDLFRKLASGGDSEESLLRTSGATIPTDWSSDGQFVAYHLQDAKTAFDIWMLPTGGDRTPILYLQTPANEQDGHFAPQPEGSPKWMAYQSNESNLNQIYIQAIPASGAKYQVSTMGGTLPRWRQDGKELYYLSIDQKLMAVPITLGASAQVGTPQALFTNSAMTAFFPSRDGQRFLINVPVGGEPAAAPITVVTNWQTALAK